MDSTLTPGKGTRLAHVGQLDLGDQGDQGGRLRPFLGGLGAALAWLALVGWANRRDAARRAARTVPVVLILGNRSARHRHGRERPAWVVLALVVLFAAMLLVGVVGSVTAR
jgi:hypothetical protein